MSKPKLVVDTHYLIWDLQGNSRFETALPHLKKYGAEVYISSISFWELGMLVGKKKISLPYSIKQFFSDLIRLRGYKVLHMTPEISDLVAQYANEINGDPADRVIVATALAYDAVLLTADGDLKGLSFLKTL
ncbi:MAG: PIN domain nuclease of toxin-antitoxin system [Saprospiraceae bacterium]|jgi:PIN domain nuclease of toxin-antitoxin system